ncbi:MAG: hypothetical protein ACOCTI_08760 [Phycisphaeraceae bacterium]
MIQEAIEHLAQMGRESVKPEAIHLPGDPEHVKFIRTKDGLERIENTPASRNLEVASIADLASLVTEQADRYGIEPGQATIFVNLAGVHLVFNVGAGWEHAWVMLPQTEEISVIQSWGRGDYESVGDLYRLLTRRLRHTRPDIEKLAAQVQAVDFSETSSASVSVRSGGESLGASVTREAKPHLEAPEGVQGFNAQLWKSTEATFRERVEVLIEPDPSVRAWYLQPDELSLQHFYDQQLQRLQGVVVDALGDCPVPVVRGRWKTL